MCRVQRSDLVQEAGGGLERLLSGDCSFFFVEASVATLPQCDDRHISLTAPA